MNKKVLKNLFANMCCSRCNTDFSEDSFSILRKEEEFCVIKVSCCNCNKSFGLAFLGTSSINPSIEKKDIPLDIQEGPPPISFDDVIDAHNFIKNIDNDWNKYIPKDFKEINPTPKH